MSPKQPEAKQSVFTFGDVRVEVGAFRVLKAGQRVTIEPKAFDVLVFLVENRGRLVEKQELLDAVWPATAVTENAMTRVVAQLRKALGDTASDPRYIETVPTRGYRFVADVAVLPEGAPAPDPVPRERGRRGGIVLVALALLAILAWAWMRTRRVPGDGREGAAPTVTQLTTSAGLDLYPSFSPDGAHLAYSSDRTGRFEIYVRALASEGREIPLTSDGEDNLQPRWSPDGRQIAYYSAARGGIWRVPSMGGTPKQLTDFGAAPAWSPDGATLVFQSLAQPDLSATAWGPFSPSTLWIVPAEGGTPRQLTRPGDPAGGHGSPSWSADGKRIVFGTNDSSRTEIWSVAAEGGGLAVVRKKETGEVPVYYHDPIYSPDGRFVYFSSSPGAWMGFSLWRVPAPNEPDGLGWGEAVRLPVTLQGSARHLSLSPDGRSLAYSSSSINSNIAMVRVDPATGEPAGLPVALTTASGLRSTTPTFSPDGRRLAFASGRAGAPLDVWLMDSDGGNPRLLVSGAAFPNWFPDGERVAFVARRPGRKGLWFVHVGSGREAPLLDTSPSWDWPRFSPDGRNVAYQRDSGGATNVWVAPLDGGEPRQVTFDKELAGWPLWSPDGKWLALQLRRGQDTHVAVVPAGGGDLREVISGRGESWPHSWSPDGGRIAFAGQRGGIWNLHWVATRDGREKRVTDYSKRSSYVRYPAWSPRGDRIVYEYAETGGNIWMVGLPRP